MARRVLAQLVYDLDMVEKLMQTGHLVNFDDLLSLLNA